ncbi:MAG TPA: MarR family transcriptional regulator [Thermopolyspora sp.]|jgi:Transcriptional regulators
MTNEADIHWLTPAEQRAWRAHLAAHRLLAHRLDRDLQKFGLSLNDYEILVNLSESPGRRMRMSDLASATIQSRSRLSHQVSRMEAKNLVVRETCPDDRRGTYTVLTDTGWETMRRVAPHHVASVRRHFMDRLSPELINAIEAAYTPVIAHLQQERTGDGDK